MEKKIKIKKIPANAEETRTIPFVFSDETRDSYRTVLLADNWDLDRFNKSGVAFYNHNSWSSNPDMLIGSARAWVEDNRLMGEITFEREEVNPVAEKIFRKIMAGTMKAVSVGFIPKTKGSWGVGDEAHGEKNETYYYGRCELLEISVVNIPANKNALIRTAGVDPQENFDEQQKMEEKDRILYREVGFGVENRDEEEEEIEPQLKNNEDVLVRANAALAFE